VRRARVDVLAGHAREDALHGDAGHQLGFLHGRAHGLGGAFDVRDDFAAHAAGARLADAEHLHARRRAARHDLRDDGAGLRRPDVQSSHQIGPHDQFFPRCSADHDLVVEPPSILFTRASSPAGVRPRCAVLSAGAKRGRRQVRQCQVQLAQPLGRRLAGTQHFGIRRVAQHQAHGVAVGADLRDPAEQPGLECGRHRAEERGRARASRHRRAARRRRACRTRARAGRAHRPPGRAAARPARRWPAVPACARTPPAPIPSMQHRSCRAAPLDADVRDERVPQQLLDATPSDRRTRWTSRDARWRHGGLGRQVARPVTSTRCTRNASMPAQRRRRCERRRRTDDERAAHREHQRRRIGASFMRLPPERGMTRRVRHLVDVAGTHGHEHIASRSSARSARPFRRASTRCMTSAAAAPGGVRDQLAGHALDRRFPRRVHVAHPHASAAASARRTRRQVARPAVQVRLERGDDPAAGIRAARGASVASISVGWCA
jgi:hypothetical protein